MKKLLTILTLALALCLICSAALADEAVYTAAQIAAGSKVNGHVITHNDYADQALTHTKHAEVGDVRLFYKGATGEELNFTVKVIFNDHTWVDQYDVAATCYENGYTVQKCSVCGNTRNSYYKGLLKTNHIGTTETRTFKDPTCTEEGVSKTYCTKCKQWIDGTEHPIEKIKEHQYEDFPVEIPTCVQMADPNYVYRVYWNCKFCGANYEETELGTQKVEHPCADQADFFNRFALTGWYTGHNWSDWADVLTKEGQANCKQGQQQERYCSVCKSVEKRTKPGSHALEPEWVLSAPATTLTCATDKSTVKFICKRCNGKVTGHEETAATFMTKDTVDGLVTYACSPKLTDGSFVSVPMNHEYKLTNTYLHKLANGDTWISSPTCTTIGYKEYYCIHDNTHATYKVKTADALGHNFGDWTQQSAEHWIRKCSRCPKYENHFGKLPPAENCTTHTPVEDKENSKAATCLEAGLTAYKCAVCGIELEGTPIPALGHDWDVTTKKAATCKEEGIVNRICKRCNLAETNVKVEKLAHVPGEPEVTPATTEKEGSKVVKCTVCGEVLSTEVLPKELGETEFTAEVKFGEMTLTGKADQKEGTKEAEAVYARVTYFMADGTYVVVSVPVEADGTFESMNSGNVIHVSVQIVDSAKVRPGEFNRFGGAEFDVK